MGLSMLDAAAKSVEAVRKLSKRLGIPQTLSEVGVDAAMIDEMAEWAFKDGNTECNPRPGKRGSLCRIVQDRHVSQTTHTLKRRVIDEFGSGRARGVCAFP